MSRLGRCFQTSGRLRGQEYGANVGHRSVEDVDETDFHEVSIEIPGIDVIVTISVISSVGTLAAIVCSDNGNGLLFLDHAPLVILIMLAV